MLNQVNPGQGNELQVTCWLQLSEEKSYVYLFQLECTSRAALKKAIATIGGSVTGTGFDARNNRNIIITRKTFESKKHFKDFKKSCPLDIEVI